MLEKMVSEEQEEDDFRLVKDSGPSEDSISNNSDNEQLQYEDIADLNDSFF